MGVLGLALTTASAQPVNDTCATALPIGCGEIVTGTTVGAAPESLGNCGTSDGSAGAVWYVFTGTGNEIVLTTCHAGSNYDTKLRVYTGSCAGLVCVTGNDDFSCAFNNLYSRVSWVSTLGVDYYILVHGFSGSQGNFEMGLTCNAPPAPDPNDDCVNATAITPGSFLGDTQANNSDGESSCGNANASPSVWYSIVPQFSLLRVQTCGSGSYDTVVSIHTGCPGTVANEVACNDNSCGLQSFVQAAVTPGATYWIRVSGASGAAGPFTLSVQDLDSTTISGADVVYSDCTSVANFGAVGGIRAYALGSHTCNIGDENLAWGSTTPLLAMNAYRLHEGRLLQIGLSFVKNGTGAAAGSGCGLPCNGQGGSVLGAGCLDVYGSSFNGIHSILGPRSAVNAFTGAYPGASGPTGTVIDKRLQVSESLLGTPGALYFVEGVYVAPDDAFNDNAHNNASYKRVTVTGANFDMSVTGHVMQVGVPALHAWQAHGLGAGVPDPSVEVQTVDVPSEGRFHVLHKVQDLGGGQWRYDYAVFNLNSHRSASTLEIPLPVGAVVTNLGFHDVSYHSGEPYDPTDWGVQVTASAVRWSSPQTFAQNPNTNALRWGTQYNFWFDANVGPAPSLAQLGLFRPGTPDALDFTVLAPGGAAPAFTRNDCNGDGGTDIADAITALGYLFPAGTPPTLPCPVACDANDDGSLDVSDPITTLAVLFVPGTIPLPPTGTCGPDPTPSPLDCPVLPICP